MSIQEQDLVLTNELQEIRGSGAVNPLKSVQQSMNDAELTAICLSGGGIRSASFCYGVLQGLAGELGKATDDFDYLSTVSGGGYIGTWLKARSSKKSGASSLAPSASEVLKSEEELAKLRKVSGYLAPAKWQFWGLIGIVLRNLLLNWVVLLPLMAAPIAFIMGLSDRVGYSIFLLLLFYLVIIAFFHFIRPAGNEERMALALKLVATWGGLVAIECFFPWLKNQLTVLGILSGISIAGLIPHVLNAHSFLTESKLNPRWILVVAAILFHLLAFFLVFWFLEDLVPDPRILFEFNFFSHNEVINVFLWYAIVLMILAFVLANILGPNRISLRSMYESRLADAFRLFDFDLEDSNKKSLYHIINCTLNQDSISGSADMERQGKSFFFSPEYSGYFGNYKRLGRYRASKAMSISGAAVSPRMGSRSSQLIFFPLSFFNARLGAWMRWNRGDNEHGLGVFDKFLSRIRELIPIRVREDELVYLSDGGHFDNMGLYEMVRRQCRYIVVVDAEQDPVISFGGMGDAIRKIKSDFRVPISLNTKNKGRGLYTGTIHYSHLNTATEKFKDGIVVVFKPELVGDPPADVVAYHRKNPSFPHQTTADQFFNESQFESYRALGKSMSEYFLDMFNNLYVRPIKTKEARLVVKRLSSVAYALKSNLKPPEKAGAIVYKKVRRGYRFFMVKSKDESTWVLPKGYIREGERAMACAMREVREELNLVPKKPPLKPTDRPFEGVRFTAEYEFRGHIFSNVYFLVSLDQLEELPEAGPLFEQWKRKKDWRSVQSVKTDNIKMVLEKAIRRIKEEG